MAANGKGNGNGPLYPAHRRRRRRQRRKREKVTSRRFAVLLTLVVILGTIAVFVAATVTGAAGILNNCSLASLKPVAIGANSFVYAADGTVLGAIPAERNRQPVGLDAMSHWVTNATVDVEDRRFYEHGGIDWEGVVRAAVENVKSGHIVQGGSTITQQLVRNLYIGKEVSLDRKIKEACLAQKVEDAHTKDWILASYLNQVYFGNHAYGVEAAAQTYFSKHAADLNLVQAALIAGLPQAPSIYDPFERPAEAVSRRNEVLGAMYSAGDITAEQYQSAVSAPLKLHAGHIYTRIREPYFFSYVREELIAKYGANTVRGGGLKVYTTIVPRFQKLATQAMQSTLNLKTDPASALVSINPKNGAIRAMTAEIPGKKNNQFNLAAQGRRQAGSSFKTFVLTEAIKEGINPDSTMYMSAPLHWQPDPSSEAWDVSTFDGSFYGPSSITPVDPPLGQQRLRTPDPRSRPGEDRHPRPPDGDQDEARACRLDRARLELGRGSRDGIRVRDDRGWRDLLRADGDPQGRPPKWRGRSWRRMGPRQAEARLLRRRRLPGRPHPEDERPGRHGHWCEPGLPGRGQDRNDGRFRRRLVRRDHDDRLHRGLGRLPEREDPDDRGARDPCRRRHLPSDDLAPLHGRRLRQQPAGRLGAAEQPGHLAAVPRPVRVLRSALDVVEVHGHEEAQQPAAHDDRGAAHDDRAAADDD